ncbi:hypothetical protein ACOSP7_008528 [Xanthoceras sorbifolium]|uniref:Uncharacterized protein n=1 Tax=Xanthoceras sorbifolium TaxID=99658 RepID=A0ABQ8ICP8_9ROSI|nr:hypothetical protein JRO89_XS03G0293900 [Xanthoceras sorbifolium]KAH7574423.1 hypothetical protein JRO89_XS03G0294300 [Xanthoceras sorbifolium]
MRKYLSMFKRKDMGSFQTLVCVKHVKQEVAEEWDESMPLPGDIIEGFAEDDVDVLYAPAKAKSDLSSQLGKISQRGEAIWVKVRRGDSILKLHVRIMQEKSSMLQRKFTIKAARDDRHVAVLGDLTLEQCTELQEMSRRVVNVDYRGYSQKAVKYEWKLKVATYLPDQRSIVVSSILFAPLQDEYSIEATTARCMAWFSAAVSSGAPLVFVNIQTEQITTSEKQNFSGSGREISLGRQQNHTTTMQMVKGIRLWFLPGVAEVLLELTPEPGEARFGMDIKRIEEGFFCVYSVSKRSAADRAGLLQLYEEANKSGHLLLISRLEGKSVMPSSASSDGLLHCCDHNELRGILSSAIDQMDGIQVHIMAWPKQTRPATSRADAAAVLQPPGPYCSPPRL